MARLPGIAARQPLLVQFHSCAPTPAQSTEHSVQPSTATTPLETIISTTQTRAQQLLLVPAAAVLPYNTITHPLHTMMHRPGMCTMATRYFIAEGTSHSTVNTHTKCKQHYYTTGVDCESRKRSAAHRLQLVQAALIKEGQLRLPGEPAALLLLLQWLVRLLHLIAGTLGSILQCGVLGGHGGAAQVRGVVAWGMNSRAAAASPAPAVQIGYRGVGTGAHATRKLPLTCVEEGWLLRPCWQLAARPKVPCRTDAMALTQTSTIAWRVQEQGL